MTHLPNFHSDHLVVPVPAAELARLRASHAALLEALQAAKLQHYTCEDCWYSCPKCDEGCCNENEGDECTCGADEHNAAIDAAIDAARKVAPVEWHDDRPDGRPDLHTSTQPGDLDTFGRPLKAGR